MRIVPEGDGSAFIGLQREQALRDAETFVSRPGHPIFGLAAPVLRPAIIAQSSVVNGQWTQIRLAYGNAGAGAYVRVTTTAAEGGLVAWTGGGPPPTGPGDGVAAELRSAVDDIEQAAAGSRALAGAAEVAAGPVPERLPAGNALVLRGGAAWAARLVVGGAANGAVDSADAVTVTVAGLNLAPRDVRLETLADLRPLIEAQLAGLLRRIEQRRRPSPEPPPPVPLEPAEGVAALRALGDFLLATWADRSTQPGRQTGHDWSARYGALWRRAAAEYQRLSGADARAADEVVSEAVNHLGHLAENAPWFATVPRLRDAAIDETLRHAMLGEAGPSEPAQLAWSQLWAVRTADPRRLSGPEDGLAEAATRLALNTEWRAAWQAWTRLA